MRKLLFSAVAMVMLNNAPMSAQPQPAASPEALKAATELFEVISRDMLTQLAQGVTAQFWPTLEAKIGRGVDPEMMKELRAEFDRVLNKFLDQSMKEAPPIYARHFTAEELRDIAAFYRTPTGAKALRLLPQVLLEFNAVLAGSMAAMEQELARSIEGILRKYGKPN